MSMPGFVFHIICSECNFQSNECSIFPFLVLGYPEISLPVMNRKNRCWGSVQFTLNPEQVGELKSDPNKLQEFAGSLSTENLIMYVPKMRIQNQEFEVSLSPEPACPVCDNHCKVVKGYPVQEARHSIEKYSKDDLENLPLYLIDLSVRTLNICSELGVGTLGQMRQSRVQIINHPGAVETTSEEIYKLIKE